MRYIALITALILSFSAYGISFKKKDNFTKIQTDKGEYTYMDISSLVIIYDMGEKTAYLGYHDTAPKANASGEFIPIFLPLRSFEFDTNELFQKWIKSVKPYNKCLTQSGLVKCE